jgi:hypothetical protein
MAFADTLFACDLFVSLCPLPPCGNFSALNFRSSETFLIHFAGSYYAPKAKADGSDSAPSAAATGARDRVVSI